MPQNKNKQFNTYKEGLDLEFLREYCMEHGERRTFERGETLEEADMPCVVRVSSVLDKSSFTIIMEKPNDEEV